MADESSEKKQRAKVIPEWRRYGDPRNIDGHFRPKKNLRTLYGKGRKWTRESLAEAMGMKDPSLISKWVTGKRYMYDEDVVRCAMAAEVSVAWLLDLSSISTSQGWTQDMLVEPHRIQDGIRRFSEGGTWEELAQDYHSGISAVRDWHEDIDRAILGMSDCKDMREFERMKFDEEEGSYYRQIEDHAYGITPPPPWGLIWVEEDEYHSHQEDIDVAEVATIISNIERRFPGDHRNLHHLAHAMLDEAMRYYPAKCLEEITILLNQASRISHQG